jgi:hypothetical protein
VGGWAGEKVGTSMQISPQFLRKGMRELTSDDSLGDINIQEWEVWMVTDTITSFFAYNFRTDHVMRNLYHCCYTSSLFYPPRPIDSFCSVSLGFRLPFLP